jgi:DNA polymerase, archaea type
LAIVLKTTFWLLDINPKIEDNVTELRLWGIDATGRRVLLIDRNFVAYFYAIAREGFDPASTAKKILEANPDLITKVELVEKRFFGKPVQAIKVYCKIAIETEKLAKRVRSLEEVKECLEDDIRIPMRYLIDNNLAPCSWIEAEVTEEENRLGARVDKVYCVQNKPKQIERINKPELKILSFSMISYSKEGSAKPERNPVVIVSTVASNGEEKQFVAEDSKNDRSVIEQFVLYLVQFNPDVLVSFGGNTQDWGYLTKRSHKMKETFCVDRVGKEPHTSIYGHVSFTGIANVDLVDFMDIFPEIKVKTLSNLACQLGVIEEQSEENIEEVQFAEFWDNPNKREALCQFSLRNAKNVYGSAVLLLDFAIQLSSLVSLPLDHVMTAATGFRIEWFLIKQTQKLGELIPKRLEQQYHPYAGGLVLSPKPGLHDNIAVLDFKSMYPNIMINYNLSPDTLIAQDEPEPASGVYVAPEVGYKFRKAPPGFYKEALTYLIDVRGKIRSQMKALKQGTIEYGILDARQKAVKIITNAAYGYVGWVGARWYIKPVGEAASAWGRHTILSASKLAESKGLAIIYGDTDSLFLTNDPKKLQDLKAEINDKLGLEVEVSEVYKRIFFTEAKKRYAGLRMDDTLDIVGLEVIRGDWAQVAKKVQEHVLEIILKEQSSKKAVDYVHSVINELRQRKTQLRDLVIWKTLTKPPAQYAIRAPHVEAAKMLKEKGWNLTSGDKVGYVILAGKGRFYSRVKPYVFAKPEEVDVDYYINNQVVPAAARILGFFNVSERELANLELKESEEIRSLMDYL